MALFTTITAAVGEKSMGKPAPNKPDDVRKIQALLRKVFGTAIPEMKDGVCDPVMKAAIAEFQTLWGGIADSTVDPVGQTLKRLNRLANPLELKVISLGRVLEAYQKGKMINNGGGYNIAVRTSDDGPLPPTGGGYTLHLAVHNDSSAIDVTGSRLHDLMTMNNLGDLLGIFEKLALWGVTVQCRAQLRYKGQVVTTSSPQFMATPVRPHNGKMVPLDEEGNGPMLSYQGDPATKDFHGRMFVQVPGYAKYLFVYGGQLETKNEFRGFDCITYAGTACGASNYHMADSDDLAESLDAEECSIQRKTKDPKTGQELSTPVNLETVDPAEVKAFFANEKTDSFLMWTTGHIVLVVKGIVHEFKASPPSGYAQTPVADWLEPYKTKKLTVRRLPGPPARAA